MGSGLKRREDWPLRLAQAVEAARARPFVWGEQDCALFAADCVLAMTNDDLAHDWRGTYCSSREAYAALRARGGLRQVAADALGETVPVLMAQRGDVMAKRERGRYALGVCLGAEAAFAGPTGVTFIPVSQCALAWRV